MKPVEHYETVLRERLAELEARLHKIEDDLDEPADPDFEERASERSNDEVLEEIGATGLQEIRQIRAALDRVKQGSFGECVKCGEAISEERLDVVPYAALCRNCAS
ncbi:MAG TPA: TraR/DksA family transcriptional regulator [Paracoccaceae bacterium]|nr:TraR/DksA family transcriptional regulator [Paracoccaceae bacterium]